MAKISLISVCHTDYTGQIVSKLEDDAYNTLTSMGNEVLLHSDITDIDKARKAVRHTLSSDVNGVVLLLSGWIECSVAMTVAKNLKALPFCLLGVPMFEFQGKLESTGSYVSYAMFNGSLNRLKYKFYGILGNLSDKDTAAKLKSFCSAAYAFTRLNNAKIALFGYTSMSIYTGTFDHLFMREKIGPEIEHIDSYTLINVAESMDDKDIEKASEKLYGKAIVSSDISSSILKKTLSIYCALTSLTDKHKWDAVNVKCQYEFSKEYKAVPCVALSMLADTGTVASCEGDILCTVSMLMLSLLSGDTVSYGDTINHSGNVLTLSACGFMPFSMGKEEKKVTNFMPHEGFTGIQCGFCGKEGKVTALRLVEDLGSYHFICFTGTAKDTPLRQGYMPAADIELCGSIDKLIDNYNGQHFAFCYGDYLKDVMVLSKLLGIQTITLL